LADLARYDRGMCSRYETPHQLELERALHVGGRDARRGGSVFPRG